MNSNEQLALQLLERNRVGVLLRIFATTPDAVEPQIESAFRALHRLLMLRTGVKRTFARIDFLVSSDPDFNDSDCGLTATRLRERVRDEFPNDPIHVLEIKKGDIFATILNYGIANQLEDRIAYSFIVSHWAEAYITKRNTEALLAAMQCQARVAGLAIGEVAETVRLGRIANTFAVWHNKSLVTVGGFDLRAGKPDKVTEGTTETITATSRGEQQITKYHRAGTEEIIPLLRMAKLFGPCIKVIEPEILHDTSINDFDDTWRQRHAAKLATKDARQRYMASLVNIPIDVLKESVIN